MSLDDLKPKSFYDEEGRVKDVGIARKMAEKENQFRDRGKPGGEGEYAAEQIGVVEQDRRGVEINREDVPDNVLEAFREKLKDVRYVGGDMDKLHPDTNPSWHFRRKEEPGIDSEFFLHFSYTPVGEERERRKEWVLGIRMSKDEENRIESITDYSNKNKLD